MSQPKQPEWQSLPLVSPIHIRPQPAPSEFAVGATAGANKVIVLQFATVVGVMQYFLAPETAKLLAQQLTDAAGGIVVVPAGTI